MTRGVRKAKKPMLKRIQDKFTVGDGCWEWTGMKCPQGYGRITDGDRKVHQAHRVLYELLVGPIPEGLGLDHLCHTNDPTCRGGATCLHRRCVNPGHLEPVTSIENFRRGVRWESFKTECPWGHPYDEANTGPTTDGRRCRACHRENERKRRDRREAGL